MSSRREKRIISELKELEKSTDVLEQSGIYFHYNDENINSLYIMLVGPSETPYEKGFYFFKFDYPESYPMQPPTAKYFTQGQLINIENKNKFNVRFNPNLYVCGKVCLSMLNTWSGPGWVPTNTITNVIVAIQALVLNDYPLTNEPGFENAAKKELEKYNEIINLANIQISVIEMIKNTPKDFRVFKEKIITIFLKNIEWYKNFVLKKNDELGISIIHSPAYGMKIECNYPEILYELTSLEEGLMAEYIEKTTLNCDNV